jgi:FKBP-type peptidyl-prolyl cis-trans isomerase FklB
MNQTVHATSARGRHPDGAPLGAGQGRPGGPATRPAIAAARRARRTVAAAAVSLAIGAAGCALTAVPLAAGARGEQPAPLPAAAPRSDGGIAGTPAATLGYSLGLRIGSRIAADFKGQQPAVDPAALARGLADAVLEARPQLDEKTIRQTLEAFDTKMREREREFARKMAEAAKVNLAKAAEFAQTNGRKAGVVTRPSGLQYEVLREGTGPSPTLDDTVVAHYRGTHVDGSEFDGTDPQGEPATFPLRGVVPGWQEALPLMKTGARWRIYVPPELGYGAEGSPPVIEPNELLVFEIELVRFVKGAAAPR